MLFSCGSDWLSPNGMLPKYDWRESVWMMVWPCSEARVLELTEPCTEDTSLIFGQSDWLEGVMELLADSLSMSAVWVLVPALQWVALVEADTE